MQDKSWLSRTTLLIGEEALDKLVNSHVMVVGLGGVGSYAAEFICRAGVGKMTIIDGDVVDPTNRNRQLPALATNHGVSKADIMAERLKAINPELELIVVKEFITPERVEELLDTNPDYVIDAIDSFTPKTTFMRIAHNRNIRFVSSMGAGGKVDPTRLKVTELSKTYNCPFAMKVRKRMRKYGVNGKGVTVVFSDEMPIEESLMMTDGSNFKKSFYGTISYVPAAFGGAVASVAIRELMK
ncbi:MULTISPECIES: tRNA threonylcarbamoyladenosine dehydratase [Edaphocola]|jgi:tRNA A37 threonylcarbamoyladenosine dehydratase|uniref:tRNA threonylcarbamoyladenosine dehydratase n=1 Tax=Edaphocola TaxID=2601681 RepID=UPI000FBE367C|nr:MULTISPECIES: tRNA threonylcarbamoyladenosine dehydratase [Edaphocola]